MAPLRDGVPDGTYAVDRRAVSADSHLVHGGFTFVIGGGALGNVSASASTGSSELPLGITFAVIRSVVFGAAATHGQYVFPIAVGLGGTTTTPGQPVKRSQLAYVR